MGLFGGDSSSSQSGVESGNQQSTGLAPNVNLSTGRDFEDNNLSITSNIHQEITDGGLVEAGSQAISEALAFAGDSASDAFSFGSDAFGFGSDSLGIARDVSESAISENTALAGHALDTNYASQELATDLSGHALDLTAAAFGNFGESLTGLTSQFGDLLAGQNAQALTAAEEATDNATDLIADYTRPDSERDSRVLQTAMIVAGLVAVAAVGVTLLRN